MNLQLSVKEVRIDAKRICHKVMNDRGFWKFAATEWHRLYAPYVPMKTGMLFSTVSIRPKEIEHTVPYAQYQYNGTNFRFSHQAHPKASAKWDKKAEATQKPRLVTTLQNYINSGGLRLND